MSEPATLPERVKERMDALGLNPFSAATKAGLGADYVRDILRGKVKSPGADKLARLAETLETSTVYLLTGEEVIPTVHDRLGDETTARPMYAHEPTSPLRLPGSLPASAIGLLPIRFELMAETYRSAMAVNRGNLGLEAAIIPPAYRGQECWFEIVRDDTMSRIAPKGSLVMVVAFDDDNREQLLEGDVVVVQKRFSDPEMTVNAVERSLRQVWRTMPELGLWFFHYASAEDPEGDFTDEVFREEPRPPRDGDVRRMALDNLDFSDISDDLSLDEKADEVHRRVEAEMERLRTSGALPKTVPAPSTEASVKAMERLMAYERPEMRDQFLRDMEMARRTRPRVVGKVIRVIVPTDPLAGFGV